MNVMEWVQRFNQAAEERGLNPDSLTLDESAASVQAMQDDLDPDTVVDTIIRCRAVQERQARIMVPIQLLVNVWRGRTTNESAVVWHLSTLN